ncbi:MAG TPA: hypothetical protein PK762_00255 [Candidatus Kapabacteria bacterium]|nr:hypothetical protein [Candidatus Kapabacteria bacterium]
MNNNDYQIVPENEEFGKHLQMLYKSYKDDPIADLLREKFKEKPVDDFYKNYKKKLLIRNITIIVLLILFITLVTIYFISKGGPTQHPTPPQITDYSYLYILKFEQLDKEKNIRIANFILDSMQKDLKISIISENSTDTITLDTSNIQQKDSLINILSIPVKTDWKDISYIFKVALNKCKQQFKKCNLLMIGNMPHTEQDNIYKGSILKKEEINIIREKVDTIVYFLSNKKITNTTNQFLINMSDTSMSNVSVIKKTL